MAETLLLTCHLALAVALLAASLSHLLATTITHLSPSPSSSPAHHHHRLLRLLRHPLLRLLPPLLALPFPFLPLAPTPLLPLLLLPPLLPLLTLPFLPHPGHLPLLRALLLALPLALLARAANLLAAAVPASDLQAHALAVARVLLAAASAASLAASLTTSSAVHFAAEAALACAGAVGGLWAAQTGLTLYVDACVPAGCHRLLDATGGTAAPPATRCDVEEARLRAVAGMDLALSVHCVVVASVAAGVLLAVARWLGVDGGAGGGGGGAGRRHGGASYDALPTAAVAEMEHLQGKGGCG